MSFEFDITCPACNRKFKESASTMEPGKTRTCPSCGKTLEYTGDDVNEGERDINSAMADLKKSLEKPDK